MSAINSKNARRVKRIIRRRWQHLDGTKDAYGTRMCCLARRTTQTRARGSSSSSLSSSLSSVSTTRTSTGIYVPLRPRLMASDQLQANIVGKRYLLDVNVEHLIMANEHLADKLKNEPADMLPLVNHGCNVLICSLKTRSRNLHSKRFSLFQEKSRLTTPRGTAFPTARSRSIQTRIPHPFET